MRLQRKFYDDGSWKIFAFVVFRFLKVLCCYYALLGNWRFLFLLWSPVRHSLSIVEQRSENSIQWEANVSDEVRILHERIDKECPNSVGWRVVSLLEFLKVLEKQEFDLQSKHSSDCSRLQQEIDKHDKILLSSGYEDPDVFHPSLQDATERLDLAKKKKHRQTRKHYDTYNALLEIKELMLKETSLLNSISFQLQNAITSADGRIKLIDSLVGILNGTQQELEKLQLALESEQKSCDAIKEKYMTAISEQRQSSSLLKLFQEECARNERLRVQIHEHGQRCT